MTSRRTWIRVGATVLLALGAVSAPALAGASGSGPGDLLPPISTPAVTTPAIQAPVVPALPVTVPPVTVPSVTVPPVTVPPATVPPVTVPSVTVPPVTTPPVHVGPVAVPRVATPAIATPTVTVAPVVSSKTTVPAVSLPAAVAATTAKVRAVVPAVPSARVRKPRHPSASRAAAEPKSQPARVVRARRVERAAAAALRRLVRARRIARAKRARHHHVPKPVPPIVAPTTTPLMLPTESTVAPDTSADVLVAPETLAPGPASFVMAVSTALTPTSPSLEPIPNDSTRWTTTASTAPGAWLIEGRIVPAGGLIARSLTLATADAGAASPRATRSPSASPRPDVAATTSGGRTEAAETPAPARGLGFHSPIGRFAITSSGVLLAGSDDGSASVRLAVPAGLVGAAALLGLLAILGQRRAERRQRVVR